MISNNAPTTTTPTLTGIVITQAIAFFGCVVVPTIITLMAPLTNIEFQHSNSGTTTTVNRYVLIFIPWKTEQISNVTKVRAEITAEKRYRGTLEERRKGQKGVSVATGQVAIINAGPEVIVQASPVLANQIETQFDEFIADKTAKPMILAVYASWPLSYILGGGVSLLCGFYVVCVILAVLTYPFKIMWSLFRINKTSEM